MKIATLEEGGLRAVLSSLARHLSRGWWGKWQNTRSQIVKAIFFPDFFTAQKKKVLLCNSGVEFSSEAKQLSDI